MTQEIATIIAATIGVIGVVVTAVVTYCEHKRQEWNNKIGKERIAWLKVFREELGVIMEAYYVATNKIKSNDRNSIIQKGVNAKYVLISRLNTTTYNGNEYNIPFKNMLFNIDFGNANCVLDEKEFMRLANLILEREWAKIKEETKYHEE